MFDILSKDVLDLDELRLEHNETELPLKSFKLTSKGSLYTSVMTGAEIVLRGEHDLKGEWLKPLRYIAHRQVDNGQVKVVEYELQGVVESEYDLGKDETKLITYDRMIHFQRPYDESFSVTTVGEILELFASKHNLEVDFIKDVSNVVIDKDYWETDLSYNYRDVLNDIAEFTQTTIAIRNNKLTVFDVIDTGFEIVTAESIVFKGEYQANIVNISYEPQHDNHYAPEDVLIEGSPDYIPLEERTELLFENNPIMLENAQQHALDVLEAVRHLKYETGEFRVAHLGVFYVGDKVLLNGKEIVITEQVYDTGNVMVDLVSDRPNGYREQYLVETDQKRQGQETSLVVDKLNGTITANVIKVGNLEQKTTSMEIDIDGLENTVKYLNKGNIIPNLNGESDYFGWSSTGRLKFVADLKFFDDMKFNFSAMPLETDTASQKGWLFFDVGEMISPFGYIVDNTEEYSFRVRKPNTANGYLYVYEYINKESPYTNKIIKAIGNGVDFATTVDLQPNTNYVRIGLKMEASTSDRVLLSEMMFNQGKPKAWFASPIDSLVYAQSSRKQLANAIVDVAEEVNKVDGKINNTTVKITGKDGVVIHNNNGKGLTVLNDDDEKVIELDSDGNIVSRKMTSIDMVAENIKAVTGKIGRFNIEGDDLVYESELFDYPYDYSDYARVGEIILRSLTPSDYELYIYDINKSGTINSADYIAIANIINGVTSHPNIKVKSRIVVGTISGKVETTSVTENNLEGETLIITADRIKSNLGDFAALSTESFAFKGQDIEIDSNGWLKVK